MAKKAKRARTAGGTGRKGARKSASRTTARRRGRARQTLIGRQQRKVRSAARKTSAKSAKAVKEALKALGTLRKKIERALHV